MTEQQTKPDPDLLDRMADAMEATAEFIDGSATSEVNRIMRITGPLPPQAATSILKFQAAMMHKLASNVREGKMTHSRERCSTDG